MGIQPDRRSLEIGELKIDCAMFRGLVDWNIQSELAPDEHHDGDCGKQRQRADDIDSVPPCHVFKLLIGVWHNLFLIECDHFIREQFFLAGCACRETVAAVIDNGLDLEIVVCAAALQGRETGWLDKIAPLLAA